MRYKTLRQKLEALGSSSSQEHIADITGSSRATIQRTIGSRPTRQFSVKEMDRLLDYIGEDKTDSNYKRYFSTLGIENERHTDKLVRDISDIINEYKETHTW